MKGFELKPDAQQALDFPQLNVHLWKFSTLLPINSVIITSLQWKSL
jgi:hypothetical protein